MSDYRIPDDALKDAAEALPVEINFYDLCANKWRPNEQYGASEYVRPNTPTGFAYQASGGTSGTREPKWPTTLTQTVVDGSITWTCSVAGANGLNAISSPSAASDPTGLTIAAPSVSETAKLTTTYSSGTLDQDYDAVFTFTLQGVTRVARQLVKVRKR